MSRKTQVHKFVSAGKEFISFNHPDFNTRLKEYSQSYVSNLASSKSWKVDTRLVNGRRYICPETTYLMLKLGLNVEGATKLYAGGSVNIFAFQDEIKDACRRVIQGPNSFESHSKNNGAKEDWAYDAFEGNSIDDLL